MTDKEVQDLHDELLDYVNKVGDGKDFEILSIEIRHRIDVLNEMADNSIDSHDPGDFRFITGICYQYYRLLYG